MQQPVVELARAARPAGDVQDGPHEATQIRLWEELLSEEAKAGNIRLSVDAHSLAYSIVRISESFLYADLIAGEEPDVEKAAAIVRLLLR